MHIFSIAPMLDITDRHCRVFFRLFSPHIRLYTEMIHCGAILFGDRQRFLEFDQSEHPIALQLGGSDPAQLAEAAKIAEDYGYDEVNLNVGCPSDRVQAGRFGACLMAEPQLVAECIDTMSAAVTIPVTVKNRIGIDDQDVENTLGHFIDMVSQAGCQEFIIHARKAWLKGLSPKDNRNIPPLEYERVYALAVSNPQLQICINGGINNLDDARLHLNHVNGVMMGRAAIDNPWLLSQVHRLYDDKIVPVLSRAAIVQSYCEYLEKQLSRGVWLKHMVAPLMGLYKGQPNAKFWRRSLAEQCRAPGAGIALILGALNEMNQHADEPELISAY